MSRGVGRCTSEWSVGELKSAVRCAHLIAHTADLLTRAPGDPAPLSTRERNISVRNNATCRGLAGNAGICRVDDDHVHHVFQLEAYLESVELAFEDF